MNLGEAMDIIEAKFQENGECNSCGWFGSLSDYDLPEDIEICEDKGYIRLPCKNKDVESWNHRGVHIDF